VRWTFGTAVGAPDPARGTTSRGAALRKCSVPDGNRTRATCSSMAGLLTASVGQGVRRPGKATPPRDASTRDIRTATSTVPTAIAVSIEYTPAIPPP